MSPRGRPSIGGGHINVRLGEPLLTEIDDWAREHDVKRAEAIRQLLAIGLNRERRRQARA